MDDDFRAMARGQHGAALDMLENAVEACPPDLWADGSRPPQFWYLVFHTLFWLDYHFHESPETFRPPPPFTLAELDPAGVMPERVYGKRELLAYLGHCRARCRATFDGLTDAKARARRRLGSSTEGSFAELLLYDMRHVQHHVAQLNLMLRRATDSAPGWVARSART